MRAYLEQTGAMWVMDWWMGRRGTGPAAGTSHHQTRLPATTSHGVEHMRRALLSLLAVVWAQWLPC